MVCAESIRAEMEKCDEGRRRAWAARMAELVARTLVVYKRKIILVAGVSCYVASTCIHSGSGQIEGTPGPLVLNTWSDCCGMGTENFALKMLQLGVQLWLKPA